MSLHSPRRHPETDARILAPSFRTLLSLGLLVAILWARPAVAGNTWDGGGANGNWSTLANWNSDTTPTSPTGLTFAGILQLAANNDLFAAGTQFNGITFNAGAGAFTLTGNAITLGSNVANNSTNLQTINLDLSSASNRTYTTTADGGDLMIGGTISGSGGVSKTGSGTLTLNAVNSYTGMTTVSSGTLKLGSGATLGSYLLTISGTGSFDLNGNNVSAGAPYSNDSSALTSTSPNAITNSSGTPATFSFIDNGASIPAGSGFTGLLSVVLTAANNNNFNVGSDFSNTGDVTFGIVGSNPMLVTGSVNNTGTVTNASSTSPTTTISGVIGANVTGVTQNGVGTLALANTNLYTGATTASAGTLLLDFNAAGAPTSDIVNPGSPLVLNGGTLNVRGKTTGTTSQTMASLTLNANTSSGITVNDNGGAGTTLAFTSTIWSKGADSALLVDISAGGTLAGPTNIAATNGILPWVAVKDATATGFGMLDGSNNIVRYTGATTLTDTATSATTNYKLAANLTLNAANGTSRPMNSLEISTGGGGTLTINSTVVAAPAAILADASYTIAGSGQLGASDANLPVNVASGRTLTVSAPISSGTGSLTKLGAGTLVLLGSKTFTGDTIIAGGTLQLGTNSGSADGNLASSAIINNGKLVLQGGPDRTLAGNISGTGSVEKGTTWANIWTIAGDNSYAGTTSVNQGNLLITHSNALGSIVSGTSVASGMTLGLGNNIAVGAETLSIGGTGTTNWQGTGSANGALRNDSGDNSWAGPVILTANTRFYATAGSLTMSGGITGTNRTLTLDGPGDFVLGGNLTTGTGGLIRNGVGNLALTGTNSYTGATTLNGGIVTVNSLATGGTASSIGQSTSDAANLVINGATLRYTGGATSTDRLFTVGANGATLDASGTGAVEFSNPGTLVLTGTDTARLLTLTGSNPGLNTLAAVIGDNGTGATSVAKLGNGTWVLTGAHLYTGPTSVGAGTLVVEGDIASSSQVTVSANASLAGNGTIGAIGGAGSVDPGDSPGLLTAAQVDPTGGLDFNFEFTLANAVPNWAAVDNDVLRLTDPTTPFTAALDGTNLISLYLSSAVAAGLGKDDILYGGFYTDAGDPLADLAAAGLDVFVEDAGGSILYHGVLYSPFANASAFVLGTVANGEFSQAGFLTTFTYAIPEPTSLALLALAGLAMLHRHRKPGPGLVRPA